MIDYKKMYMILCRAVNASLDILEESFIQTEQIAQTRTVLQKALDAAEDIYIDGCEKTNDR